MEEAIRREAPAIAVKANPVTGRVLLEWHSSETADPPRDLVTRALLVKPLSETAYIAWRGEVDIRTRSLVGKLVLGGLKLSMAFMNKLIFGAFMGDRWERRL
jgi:hypothetical protein